MSVLSKSTIEARREKIFVEGSRTANVRAAKYWLTLSKHNLILPSGKRYDEDTPCASNFVIEPGETAFVSTEERIAMPPDLIGLIGPRFNVAEIGVLFFGGMIIDPGFGLPEPKGEPLSFYIANLGAKSIELRPGRDLIASIAFLEVDAQVDEKELLDREKLGVFAPRETREALFDPREKERPPSALGQVESVREVRDQVDKMASSVDQVVMLGIVVLIAALLGAITAAIFSVEGSDRSGDQTAQQIVGAIDRHGANTKQVTGAIERLGENLPAPHPEWHTLALTLATIVLGAILLAIVITSITAIRAWANGLYRKIRLRDPYPQKKR